MSRARNFFKNMQDHSIKNNIRDDLLKSEWIELINENKGISQTIRYQSTAPISVRCQCAETISIGHAGITETMMGPVGIIIPR